MWSTWFWSTSTALKKKKQISLFIHTTEDRERLCKRPGVIKMNDGINKMMFNINSHCFHPSNNAKTVILGTLLELMNADILSLQSKLQTKTYCWTEQVVFINNSQTITYQCHLSCRVLASQTTTQSLLPSCAIHEQCCSSHISERFIYSCKSYFKWLTSKLLVYRDKWRAASPFKAASVFISSPNWDAEWGELISVRIPVLCKPTVEYKEV